MILNLFSGSIIFLVTILITNFLIKSITPFMGGIFLDIPNSRSSHKEKKLKSGGLFFVLIALVSSLIEVLLNGINEFSIAILLCSIMALVGLIDDLIFLKSTKRYFLQLLISTLLVFNTNSYLDSSVLEIIFLIIFGTAVINITNFMDGIDGLISGCFLVLLIFYFTMNPSYQILIILSSIFAFLKWNWEPAKIFMGDCGSNFIGSFIFYLLLINNSNILNYDIIFILLPLFLDSSLTILRRLINKENIFQAHNKHLYQRLFRSGLSHSKVSLIYIIICTLNGISIYLNSNKIILFLTFSQIIFGFYLERFIAVKFSKN